MRASHRAPNTVRSSPVAALSAAARTHITRTVLLITSLPLVRRIRRRPRTRHRAQSTHSRTASASRPAGPPPRHTRCHSQAPQPPLRPHSCHSPIATAHPPPPHPQVESNFPSRRSGKFSESKRETTSWLVVRR